jgi:hypothetical protein
MAVDTLAAIDYAIDRSGGSTRFSLKNLMF